MIKHIVFFKLQSDSSEIKQTLKDKLMSMQGKIEVLKNIEVGIDTNRSERACDVSLITEFNSKQDLKSYASNPIHLEIIKYIKSQNMVTSVVDYEF
jgi:hypothetical protein